MQTPGKKLLLLSILTHFSVLLFAQTTSTVRGKILDKSSQEPVIQATIRVLKAQDSTYVSGTATNTRGNFTISLSPGKYILNITYLGYKDKNENIQLANSGLNLGNIFIEEDAVLLKEAVVEARPIEVLVKGDTVEYNADAYKVQEGAALEELLKKLPGAEVSSDGSITVNGRTINKILVDGKEFFSDDPKVASKNLPAAMVQKLQVLDKKSDMTMMTGFDDGNEETVINLQIRPGMKEGLFGNAYAGYGTKDRYEANAMVNYMKNDNQYTFLAGSNNTNNAGFTDLATGAFSGNRPPRGLSFGNNNGVSSSHNGGFNFSTQASPKLSVGGNVRYGYSDNDVFSNTFTQYINSTSDQYTSDLSVGRNKSGNLRTNLKMDWQVDSLTRVIFSPSLQHNYNNNVQQSNFLSTGGAMNDTINIGDTQYDGVGNGLTIGSTLDASRRLSSTGRVLSLSLSGSLSNSDSDGHNNSATRYFDGITANEVFRQVFEQQDKSTSWSAFLSYVEPLGNNHFMQLTYKYGSTHSTSDKTTYQADTLAYDYTRYLTTDFTTQNISLNYKLIRPAYNLMLGIGLEPTSLEVDIDSPDAKQRQSVRKSMVNLAPNAQFNYSWSRSKNLRLDYRGISSQPTSSQLTDGVPSGTSITIGNANLKPSFTHNLDVRFRNFSPEQGRAMMASVGMDYVLNDIVATSYLQANGRRVTEYTNVDGNISLSGRFFVNQPLANRKFSISNMGSVRFSRQKGFINGDENLAKTINIQESIGFSYRTGSVDVTLRGNIAYQQANNSLSGQTNRNTFQYGSYISGTFYLPYGFSFDTDLDYSTNSGYSSGYKQNQWLWNLSLSKSVLPNNSGTIRLKVYDILDQRSNISRTVSTTSIRDVYTNGIPRFAMLHFVYKFQMFKGGAKASDMNRMRPFDRPGGPGGRPGGR